jgi:hypothetical protein
VGLAGLLEIRDFAFDNMLDSASPIVDKLQPPEPCELYGISRFYIVNS